MGVPTVKVLPWRDVITLILVMLLLKLLEEGFQFSLSLSPLSLFYSQLAERASVFLEEAFFPMDFSLSACSKEAACWGWGGWVGVLSLVLLAF